MAEEKEKKRGMADKMYGNSPKLEREEGGKMGVKRKGAEKEEDTAAAESEDRDGAGEPLPVTVRHAMDRGHMHAKHETEHAMHDHGKHGNKHEMHSRHMEEHKSMLKRHEKEMGEGGEKEHTPEMGKEKKE